MARAGASKSLDQSAPKARRPSEAVLPAPVKAAPVKAGPVKAAAKAVRKKAEPAVVASKPKVLAAKAVTPSAKAAKAAKPSAPAGQAVKAPAVKAVNLKTKAAPAAKAPSARQRNPEVAVAEAPKAKRAGTATKAPAKAAAVATPEKSPSEVFPPKTLEKLRRLLVEERETYVRQAHDLAAEAEALAAEREPGDTQFDEESGEGDTLNVERERDLTLSASANQAVEDIDRALRRMDAGTFGVCERCGKKIAVARLEALPFAALCIECKSREERRR
jgi:RNA polymerase-binding protein DksA